MSAVNSRDGGDESYSMYPKSSSPPLPAQGTMHFPTYQPPVPIYAYPQMPYMYAGQTPGYPFNMMNQSQMLYQGNSSMPQGSGGGSKKKWNNSSSGGSGLPNGSVSSAKTHNYHHHQGSATFHPLNSSNGGSPAANTVNLASRADQYKFEISKLDGSPAGSERKYPLLFNSTEEEYAVASNRRNGLRMKALGICNFASTQKGDVKAVEVEDIDAASSPVHINGTKTPVESDVVAQVAGETSEASGASTPDLRPTAAAPATVKTTPKSWSAIASGAISKSKSSAGSATRQDASKPLVQQPASALAPQKKDKKYIPPSTKGIEPLGSVALRMCLDPDYIDYTLKNTIFEKSLLVKSIAPRGIINRANICFMSSVLQVLLYCKPFINILNVVSARKLSPKAGLSQCTLLDACVNFYKQFDRETFEQEKSSASKGKQQSPNSVASLADAIKPDEFYSALSTIPKFKDLKWGHQEDAEEFLTHLLDQLHEEFICSIDSLTDNEIQNLLQSLNDEDLKIFFIRNLPRYKKAEFIKNPSSALKEMVAKYGTINEDNDEDGNGWHEVSGTSKKGKKNKTAAKRTVEMEPSPMSCLFGGQFRSVLDIPNNKESQSITLDPFQTIQLDISESSVNDLETAFKKFSEFELLPFKSSSGTDVQAKKQTFIDKLPQVLLIQLKRFQFISNPDKDNGMVNYNAYNGRIEKICKKINYGHELIIPIESISCKNAQRVEDKQYSLSGIIYHHGSSPDGGHYTADVYHDETDKWYRIDDVNITEVQKDDVLKGGEEGPGSRTAYILMYQKK
ncbi:hypothetical protein HG536_0H03340 [Torulaspora globosa]|uniref:Ubiquitin carboxyl-terminal hydrolase n=1 Tax=Torulaspora globosa TaxID=48254 RepID=A0A7G3ZN73_9SACH|nr:uncharacterized protein HG536_0H03340 [Torulaspora globosa]QLL34959.1 hypothetical protein HG536_0H03340 [Torulaspora globosa]